MGGDGGLAIGIDLGGTKTEIIAIDGTGAELIRRRRPTPRDDYPATVEAIRAMVVEAEAELGRAGTVGVGHPGAISPRTGRIKNANSTWLIGRPFDRDLSDALGRPVACTNDANCLALSEATDGSGAGAEVVFAVILGTGVGGGVVVRGQVLTGASAIAGEWGHNPLPWPTPEELPGPDCYCGKRGCIETWLSGPGLAADHLRVAGERLAGPEIAARAEAGAPAAAATMARYEDRLARSLATIVNVLDPDVIVLAGGLSNLRRLYANVPGSWPRYVFSGECSAELRPPMHGDSTGVRGAAWLGRALAGG